MISNKNPAPPPTTWEAIRQALLAAYEAEIQRLADLYRPQLSAGIFGPGYDATGNDWLPTSFADELRRWHPWCQSIRSSVAVAACSPWALGPHGDVEISDKRCTTHSGASALAEDVLMEAQRRGWLPARSRRAA